MASSTNSCSYCGGISNSSRIPTPEVDRFLPPDPNFIRHAADCLGQRKLGALAKAAIVLQDIFYMYREQMFERDILGAEYLNGDLFVHYDTRWRQINKPIDSLTRFPPEKFGSRIDQKAVLVHMACTDSLAWMHGLINHYIKDLVTSIHEIICQPQNSRRQLYSLDYDKKLLNPNSSHEFLLVQLQVHPNTPSGPENLYALDLTGAQYGYYYPLEPWAEYQRNRVARTHPLKTYDFGNALSLTLNRCHRPGFEGAIAILQSNLFNRLVMGVEKWEMEVGLTTVDFLALEGEYFEEMKCSLLSWLRGGIEEFLVHERE
ncbi:hypothetical protein K3495_g12973 [Podosphaera aphanis]|nr:hypothetical protein K3495_g12973 [Podosphaera aphanis]